jgi:hypothetical protein
MPTPAAGWRRSPSSGFSEFGLCLGEGTRDRPKSISLDRCIAGLHFEEIEADGAGFRALGPDAMPDRRIGILEHKALQFGLGVLVLEKGVSGGEMARVGPSSGFWPNLPS